MKTIFWFVLACITVAIFLISPWGTKVLRLGGLRVLPPVETVSKGDGEYLDGTLLVSKCRRMIRSVVRDPSAVKWNHEEVWSKDGLAHASLDFTSLNGFGGPVRETWYFTFDADGKVVSIMTPEGEQLEEAREKRRLKAAEEVAAQVEKEERKQTLAVSAQAAMEGRTLVEIEATHGKALSRDATTGWAVWPKFRARFDGGRVVEVTLP